MSHFSWLNRSVVAVLTLLILSGVALADYNTAPATPTGNNVATTGTDGQSDKFAGVGVATANTLFVLGGHLRSGTNNTSAFLVHSTNTATFTTFNGGATTDDVTMNDYIYVSGSNLHYQIGSRAVTPGSEEYGMATYFNASGTAVWNKNDRGEASQVTNFNAGVYLTAGTNSGDLFIVGSTDGSATGTVDAYAEILQSTDGSLLNPADNTTTGAAAIQWGTASHTIVLNDVIQRSDGTLIVVGSDDDGSGNDPYFRAINQDGTAITNFAAPTFAETGVLYGVVAGPGANEYIVVGATADSPTEGLIALITDNTDGTFTTQWEHTYAHATDNTVFYDGGVSGDGTDVLAVGYQGELSYAVELTDNGDNSATEDWDQTYDLVSGQDGEVLWDMRVLSTGGFIVAGYVDDASASTDALFAQFAAPATAPAPPTNTAPADAATNLDHTVGANVTLTWSAGAGGDAVTLWDVYLSSTESEVTGLDGAALLVDDQAVGTTTYDASGDLDYGTTYYWRVVAIDAGGQYREGDVWSFTTAYDGPEAPTTPGPADAATDQSITIDLTWADGVGGTDTDNWDVFFGTDSAAVANKTATQVGTAIDVGTTTVLNAALNSGNPLASGTQYFWMVVANDAGTGSTNSPVWDFTTDSPTAPTTPGPADAATGQLLTVDLTWVAGAGGTTIDNWDVYFGTDSSAVANKTATQVGTGIAAATTTVLNAALNSGNPLASGTQYFWMVVANDAGTGSTDSPVWDFTTAVPTAPTIVYPTDESTNTGVNAAYIDWAAGAGGTTVVSWDVFFGTDSANVDDKDGSVLALDDGAAATTTISVADLETFLGAEIQAETKYYWKVVANDGNVETDGPLWEFTTKATVLPAVAVIGTPADEAEDIALSASINWTDGVETDAVTGYDVYFSHEAGPVYSMLDIAKVIDDTDVLTYDPTGDMDEGTTYYWRVVARDADLDTNTGAVWSFTTVSVTYPAAAHTPTAADDATDIVVSADLTWQNGDPTGYDNVATYDLYISPTYALVAGKNASVKELAAQAAPDANANTVNTFDISVDYNGGSDFAAGTLYYWMVVATDGDGDETDGPIWAFTTAGDAPLEASLVSPANDAEVDHATVALSFNVTGATGGTVSAVATYEVYLSTTEGDITTPVNDGAAEMVSDQAPSGDPESVTNNDIETFLGIGDGEIPYSTTYYWCVVTEDADGDRTQSNVRSFTTEDDPSQNIYISYGADNGTYADNNKKAGLQPSATDGYDSGIDIPIPPDPSSHMSTYFYRSDFSDYQQKLTEEWKDYDNFTLASQVAKYDFQVVTDQTDLVTLTFDATTGNADSHPVILWSEDVNSGEYQNVLGSDADNTYTFTPDGTTTYNFTVLIGDATGPVVTPVTPNPETGFAQGDTTSFPRSSATTINIDLDDSCPVRSMTIEYSLSDDDADPRNVRGNFVALASSPVTYSSWDDPVADGGIYNANLTLDWIPVDEAGITASTYEEDAQLRFVVTDWAGNSTTEIVDIIIGSDSFTYPVDDYNDAGGNGWGTGWHLISVPLTPDEDLPVDVFTEISGNFSVFKWTEAGGMVAETDVSIANGYWLSLDASQATGLGDVSGTLAGASDNVDLTLAPAAWNLVGVTVRNEDLSGNTIEADDWVFSDDSWTSTYTWTEATTTADKGGDSNIWINATSLKSFDNNAGDYGTNIAADAALTPGYGYMLQAGTVTSGNLEMRSVRDDIDDDSVPNDPDNGATGTELDDIEGEFFVPIHISMGDFYNDLSGFGTNSEATDGWDNSYDVNAPPLPPSGNYVRAIMDRQDWNAPFGRYFVKDIRGLFDESTTEMQWDFIVYASQVGNVTMEFLANPEDFNLPEGFSATAIVNGETEFDLLQSQEITFNYTGGQVPVTIVLHYQANYVGDLLTGIPTEYAIHSVYPNPFNPSTMVRVALPEVSNLSVTVYNVLGKQVAALANGNFNAGYHNFVFNADAMASGVYFVRASVPGKLNQINKIVLVR